MMGCTVWQWSVDHESHAGPCDHESHAGPCDDARQDHMYLKQVYEQYSP